MPSFVAVLILLGTLFWLICLVIAISSNFANSSDKIIWILLLIFLPVSCVLFPFIGMKQIVK